MNTPLKSAQRLEKPIGTIHPEKTMFLRMRVGDAQLDRRKYECSNGGFGNGGPIIMSKKSGKWFTLSWQDIVTLAVKAGIDK